MNIFGIFDCILLFIIIFIFFIILIYIYYVPLLHLVIGKKVIDAGNYEHIIDGPITLDIQRAFNLSQAPMTPHYTFTFWVYLNNNPYETAQTSETTILQYGNSVPLVSLEYKRDSNISIYATPESTPDYFSLMTQKWNFIVIQYIDSRVEYYINAQLMKSASLTLTPPQYSPYDSLVIGDIPNENIVISNINFYASPLTLSQINTLYETLMTQNIPTMY